MNIRINLKDITEMVDFSLKNKTFIFKIIHQQIKDNLYNDKIDKVVIWEAYLTEYSIVFENLCYRSEWMTSLKLALRYFEKVEDYEFCIEVQDTINKLEILISE